MRHPTFRPFIFRYLPDTKISVEDRLGSGPLIRYTIDVLENFYLGPVFWGSGPGSNPMAQQVRGFNSIMGFPYSWFDMFFGAEFTWVIWPIRLWTCE